MMKPFVHLHNHTAYSLLDGATRIEDEVKRAAELGMPALAITDHGVMYGAVEFYQSCLKHGIKPIIGCEVYVARRTRFDREPGKDDAPYHLILLAENETGYRNLCKLVTLASVEGFYYRPRVDRELLAAHHEGLIAMSACLSGELPRLILSGQAKEAEDAAKWYRDLFGKENYFLEVQNHGFPEQEIVNKALATIGKKLNIDVVATNDSHYVAQADAEMQDIMLCIQTGKTYDDPDRMHFDGDQFYLKTYDEMRLALPQYEDALERTLAIADRCQFDFTLNKNYMPSFVTPGGTSLKDYLKGLCEQGLTKRYPERTEKMTNRLDFELSVIDQMGYNAYFLIVWDFIDYAKRQGIFVGPGRGSAAGSLVSYTLGITDVDPLKYDLLFERFLNPERITMPDIDVDFCYERRGEVIDYVTQKYGVEHVAQIITFGTMAAKGAIRDVGRVLNIPLATVNKICKWIPNELGITLEKAIGYSADLRELMAQDEEIDKLIKMAQRLEGLPRHAGTHAAGVVISQEPMDHYLPLQKNSDGLIVTQFAKDDVEGIGLLKMDFLGLRTLTVLNKTLEQIEKRHGHHIDFKDVDEDDPETYEMLSKGDSIAVFQMEGTGLRAVLKDLQPNSLEDIIALVALYRPGPLGSGMIDDFIDRKHGIKDIEYLHPALEPILNTTYGVILYQEQVMQIASELAGFSLGEADLLRRAMGKKKPEIIAEKRQQFVDGAAKNNIQRDVADRIFDLMAYFAGYGFNKSHSAAYGLIAFQTAYLKCHYPKEFMAEILNSFIDNLEKVTLQVAECRRLGIEVLPPDINQSGLQFTATDEGIRFGLSAIKGVGAHPVELICKERENGVFLSFQDFCLRVPMGGCMNKRVIENLIISGAFSSFGQGKKPLMQIMDECIEQGMAIQKTRNSNQLSFFDMLEESTDHLLKEIVLPECDEYCVMDNLKFEKELLGIYVSGHPLDNYLESLQRATDMVIADINDTHDGNQMTLGGLLTDIRFQTTKKGELMAYASLEDLTGVIPLLIFPRNLASLRSQLVADTAVLLRGRLNAGEEDPKIFVESIQRLPSDADLVTESKKDTQRVSCGSLSRQAEEADEKLLLKISEEEMHGQIAGRVMTVLKASQGVIPVYCYYSFSKKWMLLDQTYWTTPAYVTDALKELLGKNNVVVRKNTAP